MHNQVWLGYQSALVSLQFQIYGRLWLSVTQHPGDTVSCTEAEQLIRVVAPEIAIRWIDRMEAPEELERHGNFEGCIVNAMPITSSIFNKEGFPREIIRALGSSNAT